MALNPNRTEAPDPISIDDRLLALMREQGMTPGMAKMPGAPMIVANPLYPDAPQQAAPKKAAPAKSAGTKTAQAPLPPKRPKDVDGGEAVPATDDPNSGDEQGGYTGGAKYAGFTQPGGTQAPTPPTREAEDGRTPEEKKGNDYSLPAGIAMLGGTAGLLGYLRARSLRGETGKVEPKVMPQEAGGPAPGEYAPTQRLQQVLDTAGERRGSVDSGADAYEPTARMQELLDPTAFAEKPPIPEGRRPGVQDVPAGDVPEGRRVDRSQVPETRPGQPTWDTNRAGQEVSTQQEPKPSRSRSPKAVNDQVVTLDKSGLHVSQSDLNELIARSLVDPSAGMIRGGGKRLPKIAR